MIDAAVEAAEKAILGAALIDPRITATCKLAATDFSVAVAGALWEAIGSAHSDGLSPDPATLAPRLRDVNVPETLKLLPSLVGLGVGVNADAYAATILDRAERRRIDGALIRIRAQLEDPSKPAADVLAFAESSLLTTTSMDVAAETLWTLDEFLDRDLPDVEWVIPGLLATGERLVLTGIEGFGKALALDTPIPTPTGWTTMGALADGDLVLGADGRPARVTCAMPVQHARPCYRVEFSDGSSIIADERHEWLTETLRARDVRARYAARADETAPRGTDQRHKRKHFPAIVETGRIRDTLYARPGFINHSIVTCAPLDLPEADLPIDPYALGAWLGDGTSRAAQITTHPDDAEILDRIRSAGYTVTHLAECHWSITRREQRRAALAEAAALVDAGVSRRAALRTVGLDRRRGMEVAPIESFAAELRTAGVLENKHIPAVYLRASFEQRLDLLRGLMDTDGTIDKNGACEFTGCNERLVRGVFELLMTMGVKATIAESDATLNGRVVGRRWRILFQTDLPVFSLTRKASRLKPISRRGKLRYITAVEPVESVPVRCIEVDSDDHLFLAGPTMVPTHNSVAMRQIGVCLAAGIHPFSLHAIRPKRVLFVDCENPERIMMAKLGDLRTVIRARGAQTGDRFTLKRYPQGLNLAEPRERLDLHHLLTLVRPDLLLIGPAYKLYVGGASQREEDLARLVTSHLDGLREEFGFALVLEHHSPHGNSEGRSVRPIGSSLWLRWPEFGLGLRPQDGTKIVDRCADLVPWRGSRDERPWPHRLEPGGPGCLPWVDPTAVSRGWTPHDAIAGGAR